MEQNRFDIEKVLTPSLTALCKRLRVVSSLDETRIDTWANDQVYDLDPRIVTEQLFEHNAVILAHNTAPDPTFVFANRTAMTLWRYNWSRSLASLHADGRTRSQTQSRTITRSRA